MTPAQQFRTQIVRRVASPEPAEAFLFPVSRYPVPEPERSRLLKLMVRLSVALAARSRLSSEIFLHITPSKNPAAGALISPNARQWVPQMGMGVWPARKPPALWSKEDFAGLEPGNPPPDMVHPAFRVSAASESKENARTTMFGTGAILEILTVDSGDLLTKRGTELLLPTIQEPAYRTFPFYLPLLDAPSIAMVPFEKLQSWLCGGSVYLRESMEDLGLLVISLAPIYPVLESLGAKPDPEHRDILQLSLD